MLNVINQIIEIDQIAQNKLDAANKMKDNIMVEIKAKSEQATKLIEEKTHARVVRIKEIEQQLANEEMGKIKENTSFTLDKLEQSYTQHHEQLEQDIFNHVISID